MRLQTAPSRIATSATLTNGVLRIRIQRELKNRNADNRSPHWATKYDDWKTWRGFVLAALVDSLGYPMTYQLVGGEKSGLPNANGGLLCRCETRRCQCPASMKRRCTVTRWVPSARNFARDYINRLACTKELIDAVTRVGLLRDDSDKWLELHVDQNVSVDGLYWTEIEIARCV